MKSTVMMSAMMTLLCSVMNTNMRSGPNSLDCATICDGPMPTENAHALNA